MRQAFRDVSFPDTHASARTLTPGPASASAASGFTLVELLLGMASIVAIMAILSPAFVSSLETLHGLRPDAVDATIVHDAQSLTAAIAQAHTEAQALIEEGLATGSVNPAHVVLLRARYRDIAQAAESLLARLRAIPPAPESPHAEEVLHETIRSLTSLKIFGTMMVKILTFIESSQSSG